MKTRFLIAAAASTLFTLSTHAYVPKPEKCPSINAIESAGFTYARKLKMDDGLEHGFAFQLRSSYDTGQEWGLFIGPFDGDDELAIMKNAYASLAYLSSPYGPSEDSNRSKTGWTCVYRSNSSFAAFATTPPEIIDFPSLSKKFIK